MDYKLLFWLLFFIVIFAYCIRSEILGQDCQKTCINQVPDPLATDTTDELREKIAKGSRVIYQTVEWRKALCLSILIVLFVFLMGYILGWKMPWRRYSFDGKYPRGIDVIIPMLVTFVFLYFAFSWMQENFWKPTALKQSMQIFACDENPEKAALAVKWSKHIIKMPLETTQILFAVWHLSGGFGHFDPSDLPEKVYGLTHKHHPCIKWAGESTANYHWLARHGLQLCRNYRAFTERRHAEDVANGKKKPLVVRDHACLPLLKWLSQHTPNLPRNQRTPFAVAIVEDELSRVAVKGKDGSIDACRTYLNYAEPSVAEARAARKRQVASERKRRVK